ncbi:MAG: MFS transporter [Acidimicrobiales bacterium]|nr:MFS transporter [Acidimicrobiales bacterium]MCB9373704.1 MFS transporter [Microthrixaceae bacterium]
MSAVTASALPPFLVGALAVQVRAELGFDAAGLGVVVGAYWASSALCSAALGRAAERLGARRALRLGLTLNVVIQLTLAVAARSWGALVAVLLAGGAVNALVQLAVNVLLAHEVPPHRLGLALGAKQSAVPLGTLLAGLAVPAVALTVGWRWAFVGGAVLGVGALLALPGGGPVRGHGAGGRARIGDRPLGPLVVLAVAGALGAAAAGALAAFLVSGGVHAGIGEGAAGLLLTLGSACGIAVRLVAGARADRRGGQPLRVVAVMLAGGAVAFLAYATGIAGAYALATPLAFGAGWAWPGLFNLAVVRDNPDRPGAATGVTQTGIYVGALLGPLAFGAVVDHAGFGVAWVATAGCSVAAATVMVVGRRLLVRRSADAAVR